MTTNLSPLVRLLLVSFLAAPLATLSVRAEVVEAISSKTAKDYVRKKLPDGSFQPETYVFGKGDDLRGARVDPTIDKMDFMDVARVLSVPLAKKKYIPTTDPKTTDELIMMYWGTTRSPEHASETQSHILMQQATELKQRVVNTLVFNPSSPVANQAAKEELASIDNEILVAYIAVQAENQRREDADMKTATLLGYDSWWISSNAAMDGTAMAVRKNDMRSELEEDRYFVVLTAFDYQKLVKEKKSKFLWEVRFSIREHGTAFDDRIKGMAELASDYFGRDSGGLHHDEIPAGNVEIGPLRSLGTVAGPK